MHISIKTAIFAAIFVFWGVATARAQCPAGAGTNSCIPFPTFTNSAAVVTAPASTDRIPYVQGSSTHFIGNWIANPVNFGADPTGAADSTSAFQAMFNYVAANGTPIVMPAGTFKMSSRVATTLSAGGISISGAGAGQTTLEWTSAGSGGMAIVFANGNQSCTFRDFDITTTQQGGGTAISLAENTSSGTFASCLIQNVKFHGSDGLNLPTNYWNTNISLAGVSNVNVVNSMLYGDAGFHSTGIDFEEGGAGAAAFILNVRGTNLYNMNKAIIYGTNTQGVTFTGGSNIVSGNYGIYVPAGAVNLDQLTVSNSSINTCVIGVDELSGITATLIQGMTFIPGSGGNPPCPGGAIGVNIAGNGLVNVQGNNFQAGDPTSTGIQISNGSGRFEGNTFQFLNVGINNTAGSQFFVSLKNNTFESITTANYQNGHGDEIDGWRAFPLTLTTDGTPGTPTVSPNNGLYSRTGARMDYIIDIATSAWTGSPTGNLQFTGLPFASSATEQTGCAATNIAGTTLDAGYTSIVGIIQPNTTVVQLWEASPNTGAMAKLKVSAVNPALLQLSFNCSYDTQVPTPNGGN